jgi:cytochrome bd-type quinol oxidase subunit 2
LSKAERELIFTFYLTVIVNTLIVLFFAKARETRLFALPLILLWPMLGKYAIAFFRILDWRKALKALLKKEYSLQNQIAVAFLVLLIFISYLIAYYSYLPTGSPPEWNLFREYLFIESVLILLLSFWYWFIKKDQASEKELYS